MIPDGGMAAKERCPAACGRCNDARTSITKSLRQMNALAPHNALTLDSGAGEMDGEGWISDANELRMKKEEFTGFM
jgi:hypothetical protein